MLLELSPVPIIRLVRIRRRRENSMRSLRIRWAAIETLEDPRCEGNHVETTRRQEEELREGVGQDT